MVSWSALDTTFPDTAMCRMAEGVAPAAVDGGREALSFTLKGTLTDEPEKVDSFGVQAQMQEAKIGPDGKTFCVMIGALGPGLYWQRAVDLLEEMRHRSLDHGEHDGDAKQQVAEILLRSHKRELSQDVLRQAVADGVLKTSSDPEPYRGS
ncbi:hypothetical protein AK812_SmicGene16519 [Symbiodinium microadriaticum]|uniref:Uncharacterized protein n=1 Tax=Symbiodinium microadriaticum TaxID=2951 RepID=A0A1Q9E032_SYMMI|nr:hypothetical protein AK812_SmicGene16519 [Symbiodinium microadriaticum]